MFLPHYQSLGLLIESLTSTLRWQPGGKLKATRRPPSTSTYIKNCLSIRCLVLVQYLNLVLVRISLSRVVYTFSLAPLRRPTITQATEKVPL